MKITFRECMELSQEIESLMEELRFELEQMADDPENGVDGFKQTDKIEAENIIMFYEAIPLLKYYQRRQKMMKAESKKSKVE